MENRKPFDPIEDARRGIERDRARLGGQTILAADAFRFDEGTKALRDDTPGVVPAVEYTKDKVAAVLEK